MRDLVYLFERKESISVALGFYIACSGIKKDEERTISDIGDYDNSNSKKYKSNPEWLENNDFR